MPQCKATNTFGGEPIHCQMPLGHPNSHRWISYGGWARVFWPANLRPCGHDETGPLCACVKVRREPISAEDAFVLLARSPA